MTSAGGNITGEGALRIGLADHIVAAADFPGRLDAVARDSLEACSAGARMSKRMLSRAF